MTGIVLTAWAKVCVGEILQSAHFMQGKTDSVSEDVRRMVQEEPAAYLT